MYININGEASLIGMRVFVYTISLSRSNTGKAKTYYQHRHPGYELHYIQSGQSKVTCCGNTHILNPGMLVLIPPGAYHDVAITADNTSRLCISFDIQRKTRNSNPDIFAKSMPAVTALDGTEPEYILQKINQMLETNRDDLYKNDKLLALCSSLLLELIPCFTNSPNKYTMPQPISEPEDRNYKIDTFLGTNFMHNNAKSRMAADLYISPRQLQRVIQKNYGMSYRQKLAETRVQIAVDLLTNSDTPIHKISEILGYNCSANFSAFIKRVTGKTPSQIRKER